VLLTVESCKEVIGHRGLGAGFLIEETANFSSSGPDFDMMKNKFSFLSRGLKVTVTSMKQTL